MDEPGSVLGDLVGSNLFAWVLVFLCLFKGHDYYLSSNKYFKKEFNRVEKSSTSQRRSRTSCSSFSSFSAQHLRAPEMESTFTFDLISQSYPMPACGLLLRLRFSSRLESVLEDWWLWPVITSFRTIFWRKIFEIDFWKILLLSVKLPRSCQISFAENCWA